jgi:hypothetical protein
MSSNQPVSTISSRQLNELVRLVVRMFVNEAKAVDNDYWKANEIGQMLWGKKWAVNQSKRGDQGRVFKFNSSDWHPNMATKDFMASIDKGMKVSRFLWQTPEGSWKSLDPQTKKWADVDLTDNPSENISEDVNAEHETIVNANPASREEAIQILDLAHSLLTGGVLGQAMRKDVLAAVDRIETAFHLSDYVYDKMHPQGDEYPEGNPHVDEMTGTGAVAGFASPMAFSKRKVKEEDEPEKMKGQFVNRGEIKLDGGLDYETASKIANYHWDIFGSLGADERGVYNFKTRGDRFCCAVGMYQGKPAILSVTTTPGRLQLLVGDEAYPADSQNIKEAASGNTDPTREEMIEYLQTVYSGLLDRSSFDDAAEVAMYWFANFNHGGQSSNLYSVLSTSPYSPGRMETEPRPETVERDMFDALTREFGSEEQVNEGDEADAVNDMWAGSDDDLKGHDIGLKKKPNTKKSSKTPRKTGKALVKGKVISLKESVAPEYPFSDSQKKSLSEYFKKNQDVNFDVVAEAMSKTLGKEISSKQLYGLYVESLMDGQVAEASKKKCRIKGCSGSVKEPAETRAGLGGLCAKHVQSQQDQEHRSGEHSKMINWIHTGKHELPEEKLEEMTTTGDVSGYNVPSAFARKGGSKKGVEGSAALGYTLTPAGEKEMQRVGDRLLESKQPVRRQRCAKCNNLKPTEAHGYIEGWECADCRKPKLNEDDTYVQAHDEMVSKLKLAMFSEIPIGGNFKAGWTYPFNDFEKINDTQARNLKNGVVSTFDIKTSKVAIPK